VEGERIRARYSSNKEGPFLVTQRGKEKRVRTSARTRLKYGEKMKDRKKPQSDIQLRGGEKNRERQPEHHFTGGGEARGGNPIARAKKDDILKKGGGGKTQKN